MKRQANIKNMPVFFAFIIKIEDFYICLTKNWFNIFEYCKKNVILKKKWKYNENNGEKWYDIKN